MGVSKQGFFVFVGRVISDRNRGADREPSFKHMVSSAMGTSAEDEAPYKACTECTGLCRTTHGEGLPRSVPKFSRSIPGYALPSDGNCYLVSAFTCNCFAARNDP